MVDATTYVEGRKCQTSPSATTSLDSADIYLYGKRVSDTRILSIGLGVEGIQLEDSSKSYITTVAGNKILSKVSARFHPTNGIPTWLQNGKATHTTADTKQTITSWDVGTSKPTDSIYVKKGSLYPFIGYGVIYTDNLLTWRPKEGWIQEITGLGRKNEIANITANTPTMPTHASNTNPSDIFNVLSYFNWNSEAASIVDYVEIRQAHRTMPPSVHDDGYYNDISETQGILSTVSMVCHGIGGANDAIHTDYHAKTKRTLTLKGAKSTNSDHWFTFSSGTNEALCIQCDDMWSVGNVVYWTNTFLMDQATWVYQDYVDDDHYTIPS